MSSLNRRILFIAWDAPHSNYLEGLFVPIFKRLSDNYGYEFHIIQFSWANEERIEYLKSFCRAKNMQYSHIRIVFGPITFMGKYLTLLRGAKAVSKYIKEEKIDVIMPRSTMPARMTLSILKKNPHLKIIFDADGLPIEERVDFTGLKVNGLRYKSLKRIENLIIKKADCILTRSKKSIEILMNQNSVDSKRFFVVKNGRDESVYKLPSYSERQNTRKKLGINENDFVLIYCGSIGPQYCLKEMKYIFNGIRDKRKEAHFLLLISNSTQAEKIIGHVDGIITRSVSPQEVPSYLAIGNVALALRQQTFSMQGVAPIKLGEYLMMGLPVVASGGIGDTDIFLNNEKFAFVMQDHTKQNLNKSIEWILNLKIDEELQSQARQIGLNNFSLTESSKSYQAALKTL